MNRFVLQAFEEALALVQPFPGTNGWNLQIINPASGEDNRSDALVWTGNRTAVS
jgi:hypothetical protein